MNFIVYLTFSMTCFIGHVFSPMERDRDFLATVFCVGLFIFAPFLPYRLD